MRRLLKQLVKPAVTDAYARYCRLRYQPQSVALLCPPVPADNLGDQAMILGATAELSRRRIDNPILIVTGPRFGVEHEIRTPFTLADRHLYFGSDQSFAEECALSCDFARSRQLLVFGADVLDGKYGRVRFARTFAAIRRAISVGTPVRVIGFSVSGTPDPDALQFFRHYSDRIQLYPRDPVTLRRLRDAGAEGLTLAADVAFLMPASDESRLPEEVSRFAGSHRPHLIGVSLHSHLFDEDPERLPRYLVEVFAELARLGTAAFLFVPHHPADIDYLRQMAGLCPPDLRSRSLFVETLPAAPVAKRMFSWCRHVVTSRMHVAIASLSSGVPVTCFPYHGKFEGLFEHFQLDDDGLIELHSFPEEPAALACRLSTRIGIADDLRAGIAARLPSVVALARSNFEFGASG